MTVVVNHLHLSDALTAETEQACRDIVPRIRDAGATAARGVRVDDTHLVLILEFASAQDADRVATDVGGPWMRERILPLLARGPERSVGEVIASSKPGQHPGHGQVEQSCGHGMIIPGPAGG